MPYTIFFNEGAKPEFLFLSGARVAEWLSAPAFGPGGPGFEPWWSRPLSFHDVLGQDRFS